MIRRARLICVLLTVLLPLLATAQPAALGPASQLVELTGKVEVSLAAQPAWRAAKPGDLLKAGDKIRTGSDSRAALRLSDKSVIRINQGTVVEITPPLQPAAKSRFRIPWGSLFFLNREKPADVEFETPLATGAIRGTEFFLAVAESDRTTTLALFDGAVELRSAEETLPLASGQQAVLRAGQRAAVSAALPMRGLIQWTFYYPGVLSLADLTFSDDERTAFAAALNAYRNGALPAALAALPEEKSGASDSALAFRAALKLSVGRVDEAEGLLVKLPAAFPPARALREVIAAVRFEDVPATAEPGRHTASEWLAHSYRLQSHSRLPEALAAARQATTAAPEFGFAWARVAELEFSFEHRGAARAALARARQLAPRHTAAVTLEGFIALDENRPRAALRLFDEAIALDSALGSAWLGRAQAHELLGNSVEGRRDLQTAAALEPQRSLFRSYLGKAFSQAREDKLAEKDFRLAKEFDPADPTPWLYSALHDREVNRINDSVRELERSLDLNDNRGVFRSRLLLDRDRAVRSADLAAIYAEAGLTEFAHQAASLAVAEDYANYSGHLFLARSLEQRADPNGYDLRYETPRQSELLVANLLAPAGGGNLSQLLSQQDRLQFFGPRPFGVSLLTEYRSGGDWNQAATVFGTVAGFSYALDTQYIFHNGQRTNNEAESTRYTITAQQQLTPVDTIYFQAGLWKSESGDVAQYYNPASAKPGLRATENQQPTLYGGYHHEWSPGIHTLVLVSHLRDQFALSDPQPSVLFVRRAGTNVVSAVPQPAYRMTLASEFELTSAELQQIFETEHHALIVGGRWQHGAVETHSLVRPPLPPLGFTNHIKPDLDRANGYAYYQLRPLQSLRLTAGLSYDRLKYPINADLPPLTGAEAERSQWSPKVALDFTPWHGGNFRAAWSRSLGGLYFDNSVRLEPTQLAGFTTAYRSLIPESVAGLVPGTEFETWGAGFDQSFSTGTYFGLSGEVLSSDGERNVGLLTNSLFIPLPDRAAQTRQTLDFRERALNFYANQLIARDWSVGASYRLSEAELTGGFPALRATAPGVRAISQNERAVLGRLQLFGMFNHPTGFFAEWQSELYHQHNSGYAPARPGDDFWQHNVFAGYRFAHRRAEVRVGVLNLTDRDYRLNRLNLQAELQRTRTLVGSFRFNF